MKPMIILSISHFSVSAKFCENSMEISKFRGIGLIPQLGSKFYNPRKTVGPND